MERRRGRKGEGDCKLLWHNNKKKRERGGRRRQGEGREK